jgi:hypothetical protein
MTNCVVYYSVFWSMCCLSFYLSVIVLSILLSFDHCVVYPSVFWSLRCLSFCLLVIVLYYSVLAEFEDNKGVIRIHKTKKDRQHDDQKTEGQTTQ